MKNANRKTVNGVRPEYDFASMKGGVRGKYAKRYRAGTNLILLDPELAKAFPTEAAVNAALRALLKLTESVRLPQQGSRVVGHKARQGSFAGR
jgi:hypothetical protein